MRAETLNKRPVFELVKQSDVISFYHLQFPRWLLFGAKYASLSLEVKCVYMLLFNRCQLSQSKGWVNENGEVFIIYTRQELSQTLGLCEKRVTAAMNQLKAMEMIWERRCGRGFANQIYLSIVKISEEEAARTKGGPLNPVSSDDSSNVPVPDSCKDDKSNEANGLDKSYESDEPNEPDKPIKDEVEPDQPALSCEKPDDTVPTNSVTAHDEPRPAYLTGLNNCAESDGAEQEPAFSSKTPAPGGLSGEDKSKPPFKSRRMESSRTANPAVQDPPNRPPSYLDNKINLQESRELSQSRSSPRAHEADVQRRTDNDGRDDARELERLFAKSELSYLEDNNDKAVLKLAIERLFYSDNYNVQGAVYPNARIRANLEKLDICILESTLSRYHRNDEKITNSSAYVTKVLFNTIMESRSDLAVDPYLNFLSQKNARAAAGR